MSWWSKWIWWHTSFNPTAKSPKEGGAKEFNKEDAPFLGKGHSQVHLDLPLEVPQTKSRANKVISFLG